MTEQQNGATRQESESAAERKHSHSTRAELTRALLLAEVERDSYVWQKWQERHVRVVLNAYRRFLTEPEVTPAVAAQLTQAWVAFSRGVTTSADDRRPFHE